MFSRCRGATENCEECGDYIRHVFSMVLGSLAAISMLIVLIFQATPTTSERALAQRQTVRLITTSLVRVTKGGYFNGLT